VSSLCIGAILGAVVGIGTRQGYFVDAVGYFTDDSSEDAGETELYDLSPAGTRLSSEHYTKLLILQHHLDTARVDRTRNNAMIEELVVRYANGTETQHMGIRSQVVQPTLDYLYSSETALRYVAHICAGEPGNTLTEHGIYPGAPQPIGHEKPAIQPFKEGQTLTADDIARLDRLWSDLDGVFKKIRLTTDSILAPNIATHKQPAFLARDALVRSIAPDLDLALEAAVRSATPQRSQESNGETDDEELGSEAPHIEAANQPLHTEPRAARVLESTSFAAAR
jgi:hypothetical protein